MEKSAGRMSRFAALGAALTAFLGSCCALPILLLTLTGTVGFAASLVPYQKYFTIASLFFLGHAFYLVYGRKAVPCNEARACSPIRRKVTLILLWISALLVAIFLIGPYFLT